MANLRAVIMNRHGTSVRPLTLRGIAPAGYRSRMDYRASEMRDNPMCELTPQWAPGWATLNVRSRDCLLVPPMPGLGVTLLGAVPLEYASQVEFQYRAACSSHEALPCRGGDSLCQLIQ